MLNMLKSMINEKKSFMESTEVDMILEADELDDSIVLGEDEEPEKDEKPEEKPEEAPAEPAGEEEKPAEEPDKNAEKDADDGNSMEEVPPAEPEQPEVPAAPTVDPTPELPVEDILTQEIDLSTNTPTDTLPIPPEGASDAVVSDTMDAPVVGDDNKEDEGRVTPDTSGVDDILDEPIDNPDTSEDASGDDGMASPEEILNMEMDESHHFGHFGNPERHIEDPTRYAKQGLGSDDDDSERPGTDLYVKKYHGDSDERKKDLDDFFNSLFNDDYADSDDKKEEKCEGSKCENTDDTSSDTPIENKEITEAISFDDSGKPDDAPDANQGENIVTKAVNDKINEVDSVAADTNTSDASEPEPEAEPVQAEEIPAEEPATDSASGEAEVTTDASLNIQKRLSNLSKEIEDMRSFIIDNTTK